MNSSSPPSFPPNIRPALLSDIPRIGIVTAAGFYHSNLYAYMRPNLASYPRDSIADYRVKFSRLILDPACIVLVAEDMYVEDEREKVYPALKAADVYCEEVEGKKVTVAVMSVRLQHGSWWIGRFLPEGKSLILEREI
jgi:hypothetical protein